MNLVLSCCLILCFIWWTECVDRDKNKACYQAKICIHNNNEKCGVNGNGRLRRFIDSCDILEYNCLRGTDYVKTSYERCSKLPPIKDEKLYGRNYTTDGKAFISQIISQSEEPQNGSEEELKGEEKGLVNGSGSADEKALLDGSDESEKKLKGEYNPKEELKGVYSAKQELKGENSPKEQLKGENSSKEELKGEDGVKQQLKRKGSIKQQLKDEDR